MQMPRIRRVVVGSVASMLAVSGIVASSGAASADTTVTARYPVTGSTHLAAPNANLPLGPGKLTATLDLSTYTVTGTLSLPESTGTFNEAGLVPVTATTKLINDGPTTGTVDPNTGAITSTSTITLQIVDLKVAGVDTFVGNSCKTSTPVSVTVSSQPGFSIIKGGNVSGTYTIPSFVNCGLATLLINLTLPGPGNTITLTLGKAHFLP